MKQLTDEQVIEEIERLKNSDFVKLSKLNERKKYALRQKLYNLRWHEKQGRELAEAGITEEMIRGIDDED